MALILQPLTPAAEPLTFMNELRTPRVSSRTVTSLAENWRWEEWGHGSHCRPGEVALHQEEGVTQLVGSARHTRAHGP